MGRFGVESLRKVRVNLQFLHLMYQHHDIVGYDLAQEFIHRSCVVLALPASGGFHVSQSGFFPSRQSRKKSHASRYVANSQPSSQSIAPGGSLAFGAVRLKTTQSTLSKKRINDRPSLPFTGSINSRPSLNFVYDFITRPPQKNLFPNFPF